MSRYHFLTVALLLVAGALFYLTFRPAGVEPARAEKALSAGPEGRRPQAERPRSVSKPLRASKAEGSRPDVVRTAPAEAVKVEARPAADGGKQAEKPARERAVEEWESLVDEVSGQKDVAAAGQAQRVKEAFDKLDPADQLDGIRRSLNLFPDEQFPALYGILFDKAESPEVLDAIFSDALNRPEELKNPLMKELVKDKEHPCFFESARILDVIGELEVKPGPTASP